MNLLGSNSCNGINSNLPTGVVEEVDDSVQISYNDLRIVNSKLIELEYEKEINNKLRTIVYNDSILIENEKRINKQISIDCKKVTKERDICFGVAIATIFLSIFLLVK